MITYGSVCSGIEAATLAWESLGWRPKFFSEIEAFPSAVLAHHYGSNMPGEPLSQNGVPNYGDFTAIPGSAGPIDLLVGGTPCQSFSIAGKRLGLDDARGNLALEYVRLAKRLGARWVVWENVPGVLSSGDGRDFADFLGFLSGRDIKLPRGGWRGAGIVAGTPSSYGLAWRVLDAQFIRVDSHPRAVPQRRKRVFLVGYLGDWRRAAAVLFEPESMSGHPPPRRKAGQGVASPIAAGSPGGSGYRNDADTTDNLVSATVSSKWAKGTGGPAGDECQNLIAEVAATLPAGGNSTGGDRYPGTSAETAGSMLVAHALRADGFDASEDGTGRGTPLVPVSVPAFAFQTHFARNDRGAPSDVAYPLMAEAGRTGKGDSAQCVQVGWAVRRLMPVECERLQGVSDGYTDIRFRGKPAADGPRYKALGNSMASPPMRWIGQRIDLMERLIREGRIA